MVPTGCLLSRSPAIPGKEKTRKRMSTPPPYFFLRTARARVRAKWHFFRLHQHTFTPSPSHSTAFREKLPHAHHRFFRGASSWLVLPCAQSAVHERERTRCSVSLIIKSKQTSWIKENNPLLLFEARRTTTPRARLFSFSPFVCVFVCFFFFFSLCKRLFPCNPKRTHRCWRKIENSIYWSTHTQTQTK